MSNYPEGIKVMLHSTGVHALNGSIGTIRGAVKLNNFASPTPDLYIVELSFLYNGYSCMVLSSACLDGFLV
jgi:hypothetical protein